MASTYVLNSNNGFQFSGELACGSLAPTTVLAKQYGGSGYDLTNSSNVDSFLTDISAQHVNSYLTDISSISAPSANDILQFNGSNFVNVPASNIAGTTYTAGNGLSLSSDTFSVNYDNNTIGINGSSQLGIKHGGVPAVCIATNSLGTSQFASSVVDGTSIVLSGSSYSIGAVPASSLSSTVDGSTIVVSGSNIALGTVQNANLASACVEGTNLNSNVCDGASIVLSGTTLSLGTVSASNLTSAIDGSTIVNGGDGLQVANGSIGENQLSSGGFGAGLTGGSGSQVAVDFTRVFDLSNNQSFGHNLSLNNSGAYLEVACPAQFEGNLLLQPSGQSGYSQYNDYELQTTDATSTALATVAIPSNGALFLHGDVVCCSDDMAYYAQYNVDIACLNNAGTASIGQSNVSSIYATAGLGGVASSVSSGNLLLNVSGKASTNLRWHCNLKQVFAPKYVA